jgi:hypothetical protein
MNDTDNAADLPAQRLSRRELGTTGLALMAAAGIASQAAPAAAQAVSARSGGISVEDRLGIQDLFTSYLWAYDCTDEEEFARLFTADALVVGRGTLYNDRDAILGWFRYLIALREDAGDDIWMHEAGEFKFVRSGDAWIVYSYATHFNGNTQTGMRGVRSLGYFTCECVREADEWKFRRFSITTWDRTMVPWKKPLPWAEA